MEQGMHGPGWWQASDGRWYPPEQHPDAAALTTPPGTPTHGTPTPGAPTSGTPTPAPVGAPEPPTRDRATAGRRVAGAMVVLALVATTLAVVVVARSRHDEASAIANGEVVELEPVGSPGSDPFTTATNVRQVAAFPSSVNQVVAATQGTAPVDSATTTRIITGTTPGLYGGTNDGAVCDPAALVAFLAANPDKAAAWAAVEGITPDGIPAFVASLAPSVLTVDTRVTNHGYAAGQATTYQAVLQAGTAVLVDNTGTPRTRCACGNPLTAPTPLALTAAGVRGPAWPGYEPARGAAVTPGPATGELTLVDIATGSLYAAPVGTPPTTTGAPPATSTPPTTTPAGSGATLANGTYELQGTSTCRKGSSPFAGYKLTIFGGTATIIEAYGADSTYDGTITPSSDGVRIRTTDQFGSTIDLDGTVGPGGTLSGAGNRVYAGANIGQCQLTFNATAQAGSAPTTPAPTTTTTTAKPAKAAGAATPEAAARLLYPGVNPDPGSCGYGDGYAKYAVCPVTPELLSALSAWQYASPLCRCQNSFPVTLVSGVAPPPAVAGQPGVAVVEVQFLGIASSNTFSAKMFVLLRQQADGSWLAADLYTPARPGDPDPWANRLTVIPPQ